MAKANDVRDIRKAKNPLLWLALPALERAAKRARERAVANNTSLVVWEDNKVVWISPLELQEEAGSYSID